MIWHGYSFLLGPNLIFTPATMATMAMLSRISFQVWPFTSRFKTATIPPQINSSQRFQKEAQLSPAEVGGFIEPLDTVFGIEFVAARDRHGHVARRGINLVAGGSRDGKPIRRKRSDWWHFPQSFIESILGHQQRRQFFLNFFDSLLWFHHCAFLPFFSQAWPCRPMEASQAA